MSTAKKSNSYRLRMLTTTAMLGAMAGLLMLIEFPLGFIAPSFYKIDLSEVPVMIGTFAFGPIQGVVIELIKLLIKLIIKGTSTGFVGELANFIIGAAMVIPAGVIYRRKKTKKSAIIGMAISTVTMSVVGVFLNAYVMIPLYSAFMPIEQIVEAGKAEDVILLTRSLSDFFRISLSAGADWIPVEQELRHASAYLSIQKIRYRDILNYRVDVEGEKYDDVA